MVAYFARRIIRGVLSNRIAVMSRALKCVTLLCRVAFLHIIKRNQQSVISRRRKTFIGFKNHQSKRNKNRVMSYNLSRRWRSEIPISLMRSTQKL